MYALDGFEARVSAFIAGVGWLLFWPRLPAAWVLLSLLAVAGAGAWLARRGGRWRWLGCPALFALGIFWAGAYASFWQPLPLDAALAGRELLLEGRIADLPLRDERRQRFVFRVASARLDGVAVATPERVLLSWYRSEQVVAPGESWRFRVRLKPPRGLMNPGGRDYERWLFEQRIGAKGYVRPGSDNQRLAEAGWHGLVDRLRLHIRGYLQHLFRDPNQAAIANALLSGDRSLLSSDQHELLARAGISHLIAISGLHIGIVAALFYWLTERLWRRSERLALWCPASLAASVAALIAGLGYALLSGFAIPARRALLMLAAVAGAVLGRRFVRPLRGLALAALLVVLFDPLALLSAGFWLSFGAVGLILLALSGRRHGRLMGFARVQLAISLGLAPLLLLFFNQVSLVAPLVNLVLIPAFSLLVIPLLMLLLPGAFIGGAPFDGIAWLIGKLLDGLLGFAGMLAGLDWAAWSPPPLGAWGVALIALGVAAIMLPRGLPGRTLAAAPLLLGLSLPLTGRDTPSDGAFSLQVVDIGQGTSVVVETANHVLVYDTGPAFPGGHSAAWHSLWPLLRVAGIEHIDRLVLSHDDIDHTGGARLLYRRFSVGGMLHGEPIPAFSGRGEACVAGRNWRWDGVDFAVLWPYAAGFWSGNNASCVIRVSSGGHSLLLTGDIEAPVERQLVRRYRAGLASSVVVVPHHGSRTSSSRDFVAATRPALAVFTTGFLNRWGFPKADRLDRWEKAGARPINVSDSGRIRIDFSPREAAVVNCFRAERRRFWHHAGVPAACGAQLGRVSSVE